jgi:hypothetical protein
MCAAAANLHSQPFTAEDSGKAASGFHLRFPYRLPLDKIRIQIIWENSQRSIWRPPALCKLSSTDEVEYCLVTMNLIQYG